MAWKVVSAEFAMHGQLSRQNGTFRALREAEVWQTAQERAGDLALVALVGGIENLSNRVFGLQDGLRCRVFGMSYNTYTRHT